MKSIALSAAVMCAMSTVTFAQQVQPTTPDEAQRTGASRQESRNDPAQASADMPGDKMKAAREDRAGNQFEIQAGQIGQERAQSPQVKEMAMHIAQDHQKAQQALQEACKSDEPASASAELNPVQQAKLAELQKKQGEDFDRCFVFGMVADHEHDLLNYRWQADHAPDPNVQKYARGQIPVLEAHLKMARAASEMYVGAARQAGERMKGTNSLNNAASAGHDSHNFGSQPNNDGAGAPGGTGTDRTIRR